MIGCDQDTWLHLKSFESGLAVLKQFSLPWKERRTFGSPRPRSCWPRGSGDPSSWCSAGRRSSGGHGPAWCCSTWGTCRSPGLPWSPCAQCSRGSRSPLGQHPNQNKTNGRFYYFLLKTNQMLHFLAGFEQRGGKYPMKSEGQFKNHSSTRHG